MKSKVQNNLLAGAACLVIFLVSTQAFATLIFHYDPLSGNVSFDTAQTRSGATQTYVLNLNPFASSIRFRPENFIRITNSTFVENTDLQSGEASFGQPIRGLFTIGDILPKGLSEATWSNLFTGFFHNNFWSPTDTTLGGHTYIDVVGGGIRPPEADFIYGRPESNFDNRTDLIDPDTLIWAQRATLIYRQASGELLLDTSGIDSGYTTGFLLQSDDKFLSEHYTPLGDSQLSEGDDGSIGFFTDLIDPGQYNLGSVLEAGLSAAEFEAVFTKAIFLSRAG